MIKASLHVSGCSGGGKAGDWSCCYEFLLTLTRTMGTVPHRERCSPPPPRFGLDGAAAGLFAFPSLQLPHPLIH